MFKAESWHTPFEPKAILFKENMIKVVIGGGGGEVAKTADLKP